MGKYMRKAKITGDVAVMEILSPQSQPSLGVRTRAKTHALQSLQSNTPPPRNPEPAYLQLRNRRLEKILVNDAKKQQPQPRKNGSGLNPNPSLSPNPDMGSSIRCLEGEEGFIISDFTKRACNEIEAEDLNDLGFEASFGENYLDFETRERSTRESTPCSLIRASDTIGTPGSTTRRTPSSTATNRRIQNAMQRNIPTTLEMEEFFALAEQQQQRFFAEKYNFDVVNDLPLSGRYEWVRVNN
ncbi:hypothetical protein C3L33_07311, partial [Rhododendron williamsianum]